MAFVVQLKNETCELQKGLHVLLYMGISKARFNNDWLRLEMWQKVGVLLLLATLWLPDKSKTAENQMINSGFEYPDPGSNRDELLHWCLRPARLPIPPSGRGSRFITELRCKDSQNCLPCKFLWPLFFI